MRKSIEKIDFLKIDCEGINWKVLKGIKDEDWKKIKSCVIEVHDVDQRLNKVLKLLKHQQFNVVIEKEISLKQTKLSNVFAVKK